MKFFEKLMIDEYNEWLNEAKSKWAGPMLRRGISGDLSGAKLKSLKRVYYDVIMRSNKAQLDKLFKYIEELQKSKAKEFSDMEIDQLKDWFDERLEQLGIKESYDFKLNEVYKVAQNPDDKLWYVLGSVGKHWMPVSDGFKSKKEAEKYAKIQPKVDKLAKGWTSESINEAPIAAKGWDDSSIEKFGKTIGKDPKDKGFFDACVKRMSGKEGFDEQKAKGFCASIKDKAYGSPNWRGKDKTKEQAKKDTQKDRFKKE